MRVDGRNLSLTFDGVQVNCVATQVMLDNEDADAELVTFADVIAGNDRRWFFTIVSLPDYADQSFWSLLWDTAPYTPIPYTFVPYGNVDLASPSQPHFSGEVVVDRKPPVGGDAGSVWSFDARLTCTGNPERIVSGR